MLIVVKLKNFSPLILFTEACWQISRLTVNINEDHSINIAHENINVTKLERSDNSQGCQSFQLQISDKLKTYSPIFWSTEACWQISRFPINRNAERCINDAQDIFRVNKECDLITLTALSPTKCIPSITKELHLMDKVKTYSRLFRSTEDGWRISRLTIKLNADRSRIEAQYIIIVTK